MKDKIRVLLCSVSLEDKGGVTNYVRMILENYPKDKYLINHFVQGDTSKFIKIFYPLVILIQLVKFKEKLRQFNPDVVHINPSLAWAAIIRDYFFSRSARKNGFPVLFCMGGWDAKISKHFHKKTILQRFFFRIFDTPDRILVLAESFKNEIKELGIDQNRIVLTTMMVESEKFKPEHRTFEPPYTLLFCSRIEKLKGIYELLDAFQLILRKYPKIQLTYVGSGTEYHNLNKKISVIGLEDHITCVGYKTGAEKIHYFTHSDIMILPSYTEGFPNVFCEAMAAGLPFIGTHVGGLVDVFQDGKQGRVIQSMPPAPQEIAEKIIELLEDKKIMKQISENNIREAKAKYDVSVVIAKLDGLYQEMFERKEKHA